MTFKRSNRFSTCHAKQQDSEQHIGRSQDGEGIKLEGEVKVLIVP